MLLQPSIHSHHTVAASDTRGHVMSWKLYSISLRSTVQSNNYIIIYILL